MKPRLNPYQAAPEAMKAVAALDTYVQGSGLEPSLVELIKMRASQINGCAYCLHMHSRDARAKGETEERLCLLDARRESPLYTDRERAALGWTEAVTLVSQTHVPDDAYEELRGQFSEEEVVKLTVAIAPINAWKPRRDQLSRGSSATQAARGLKSAASRSRLLVQDREAMLVVSRARQARCREAGPI